jgi:hypothetical protein
MAHQDDRRVKLTIAEACLVMDLAQQKAAATLARASKKARRLPEKEAAAVLKRADEKASAMMRKETREALAVLMTPWSRTVWRGLKVQP